MRQREQKQKSVTPEVCQVSGVLSAKYVSFVGSDTRSLKEEVLCKFNLLPFFG